MRRSLVAVSVISAIVTFAGVKSAQAQYPTRPGYGSTGNGYGSNGAGGINGRSTGPVFTGSSSGGNAGSSAQDPNSDYNQIMNSVDKTTDQAFGPPKPDDEAEKEEDTQQQSGDGKTGGLGTGNQALAPGANPYTGTNQVSAASHISGAAGGYGGGIAGAGTGPFTTATGTTGLGQYNSNPYSNGSVTAPASNNSPVAPVYNGQ